MLLRATLIGVIVALFSGPCAAQAQGNPGPAYGGSYAAAHYSPLAQIDRTNAKNLHIAWRWRSPDQAIDEANPALGPSFVNESTPLMVSGMLYTSTSLSQVAPIDAATVGGVGILIRLHRQAEISVRTTRATATQTAIRHHFVAGFS